MSRSRPCFFLGILGLAATGGRQATTMTRPGAVHNIRQSRRGPRIRINFTDLDCREMKKETGSTTTYKAMDDMSQGALINSIPKGLRGIYVLYNKHNVVDIGMANCVAAS